MYSSYPVPVRQIPTSGFAKLTRKDSKAEGEVRFTQQDNRYIGITGRIVGLSPGAHGLHIHEKAGTGTDSCTEIGLHFNPLNSLHGGKSEWVRHVGDLGNIFADHDGVAYFDLTDTMISLSGPNSIVNRTLVVTESGDDLGKGKNESHVNGNSGKPLACGIIKVNPHPF